MTTTVASTALADGLIQSPHRSSNLDVIEGPLKVFLDPVTIPFTGPFTNNLPIEATILANFGDGPVVPTFGNDWFDRIHLIPGALALGNLLSNQTRDVEVFNAFRISKTLASITENNVDGITLTQPQPTPLNFAPLQSFIYVVNISTTGPPTVDGTYTYNFTGENPLVLAITGTRVVVFGFEPDWRQRIRERLLWLTDVLKSRNGTEQRIRLRTHPRREFEFTYLVQNHQVRTLDPILWGRQARIFAIPVWTDTQRLGADINSAEVTIPINTDNLDYHVDGLGILIQDFETFETFEIQSLTSNELTLKNPLSNGWGADTRIMPARLARLSQSTQVRRANSRVSTGRALFRVEPNTNVTEVDGATVYQGESVLETHPNRVRALTDDYTRTSETVDFETGVLIVDDPQDFPDIIRSFSWLLKNKPEIFSFRQWLHARSGRLKPVWIPTFNHDVQVIDSVIASGSTVINIRDAGINLYYQARPGRRDIQILLKDGTVFYRRVLGATAGAPGEESISIDSSLGQNVNREDIRRFSYMGLHRFESDQIEFIWHSTGVATVDANLRLLGE